MIIIEGPLGTGKSTLANLLSCKLELPVWPSVAHYRGTGDGLLEKVISDLKEWPNPRRGTGIYDTHPLINEWVYGPSQRGRLSEGFTSGSLKPWMEYFFEQSLIIYCRPPDDFIVRDERECIRTFDLILRSPLMCMARVIEYDYTTEMALNFIAAHVAQHRRLREHLP